MLAMRWPAKDKALLEKAAKACDMEPRELLLKCFYSSYQDIVRERLDEMRKQVEEFLDLDKSE